MIKPIIFGLVCIGAFGFITYNVRRLISYMQLAKPENRLDNIPRRLWLLLTVGIAQTKILRDKVAGPIHAFIFWGFLILAVSAAEGILEGFNERWSLNFLGPLYTPITILTDIFCALIIILTMAALWRRYITKVKRLQVEGEKIEAAMILITIFFIVTSILFQNSARIALGTDGSWAVRPLASILAPMIGSSSAHIMFEVFWWAHMLLVFGFMNYLPYSKHLHVLSSLPNVFFGNLTYPNQLQPINFEEEGLEKFGASDIQDFTWKTILDGYTCTHCGRCTSVCPANQTGKILDPREIIVAIHDRTMDKAPLMMKFKDYAENGASTEEQEAVTTILAGKELNDVGQALFDRMLTEEEKTLWHKKLVGEYIPIEALWACTTCGACQQECPVMIEHVPAIVDMRRTLTLMEANFSDEGAQLPDVFGNMETNYVPWGGFSHDDRDAWREGTTVQTAEENPNFDVLFWVGCAGSYDERAKKVTKAFAELMTIAGVNFSILGKEERCSGDVARRTGNEYLADSLVKTNIETMNNYHVKKIVATCPHCLNTLKNEYPLFGGDFEVTHHTQFIKELIDSGKLSIDRSVVSEATVAYHDSCYLGRYNDEYEAPRAAIENVPGLTVLEAPRSKDRGLCCGAGGGRMFMEEVVGKRVNIERTEELLETGANTIGVNCPFCMTMMTDGVKAADRIDSVSVLDISEIVLQNVKKN